MAKEKTHYTHEELLDIWTEIAECMAIGKNELSVIPVIRSRWGVSRTTADKWLNCAKQLLYTTWDNSTLAEKKAARLQTLEATIHKAMESNQLSAVVGAVRLQSELLGLLAK